MAENTEIHANEQSYRDPVVHSIGDLERDNRERTMDKTLADSFPASDPPSSLPNPSIDSFALYDA